ncbi:hypothetical protein RJ639_041003 [Escallonia herrerae]|uniref:Uncharacterized protein n=1 Tax=Escallonia herrerae TaxID=1293975 RepID=A0AA88WRG2_9ASTE|nr:hypothetical protein RJ639_041003 [Escallonia herrerae]
MTMNQTLQERVKLHVVNKRILLQFDLGSVFWRWKFDEMGEEVSNLWNFWEQKKFESLVKTNPVSTGKSFLKPALKCLPSQCRETIVNYYFNVYLPRRMSMLTRSGCEIVDTDDEASEDAPCIKGSQKRYQADNHSLNTYKYMKTKTTLLSDRH